MGQGGEDFRGEGRLSEDRHSIIEVVHNWALWRDAGDWERFRTVWHEDGWMTATWFQGPAAERPRRLLHSAAGGPLDCRLSER